MVAMARTVKVHTTSANAYCKLKKIGGFAKTTASMRYTKQVSRLFMIISRRSPGIQGGYNAQTALNRLDQLRDEVAFFFSCKSPNPYPEMEQPHSAPRERDDFGATIQLNYNRAIERLKVYREGFLARWSHFLRRALRAFSAQSKDGGHPLGNAKGSCPQRRNLQESDDRSVIRSYEDLANRYCRSFRDLGAILHDDLGRVTGEFVIQITESGKSFCDRFVLLRIFY